MSPLNKILNKRERLVIGLMSGTSADGIDAAAARLQRRNDAGVSVELLAFETAPFPDGLRQCLLDLSTPEQSRVDEICRMNFILGELFAGAAERIARTAGIPMDHIDLIGSHGQTIHHLPDRVATFGVTTGATLQIGDPSVIAQRTGVVTVGDFRPADIARGGQGAPLAPYVDFLIFRSDTMALGLLNIGGIANITALPAGATPADVIAFDTGPGNMAMDAVMQNTLGEPFDRDGRVAAQGNIWEPIVDTMLSHPYFAMPPPKSTGREMFGRDFSARLMEEGERHGLTPADMVATATEITCRSVAQSVQRFITPVTQLDEIIVSGGGAQNAYLLGRLAESMRPIGVVTSDQRGMSSEAKEAIAFAILANETIDGRPGNLPGATGADRRTVLGKICLP